MTECCWADFQSGTMRMQDSLTQGFGLFRLSCIFFYFFRRAAKGLYVSPSSATWLFRYFSAVLSCSVVVAGIREMRLFSASTACTVTENLVPGLQTFLMFVLRSTSSCEIWTSPSIPFAMFTNSPKSATLEIVPSIFVPTGNSAFTESHGSASRAFVLTEIFSAFQSAFIIWTFFPVRLLELNLYRKSFHAKFQKLVAVPEFRSGQQKLRIPAKTLQCQ